MAEAAKNTEEKERSQAMPEGQEVAAAGGAAANAPQFHPILLSRHAAKEGRDKILSRFRVNFDLSSFLSFYPDLRLLGYIWEAGFSPLARTLENTHLKTLQKAGEGEAATSFSLGEKMSLALFGKESPKQITVNAEAATGEAAWSLFSLENTPTPSPTDKVSHKYKNFINKVEAGMFTGLALLHSADGYKKLKESVKLALSAELGKDPEEIGFSDLLHSNNPLVVSAMDRLCWQTPLRVGAGLSFLPALWTGIFANSLVITAERTVFYRPLAYDVLAKAINDVQINGLGEENKAELMDNLIRVLQAERFDHRQATISREQVEALRPVLEEIANDVINKKFGIAGMIYIMGGGVLIPEDPEQSLANYRHLQEVGVSGVAAEAANLRKRNHVPSTKIWDARLQDKGRDESKIAESARREELLRERKAINARGPMHATPGSSIDPDTRYGGVQMY